MFQTSSFLIFLTVSFLLFLSADSHKKRFDQDKVFRIVAENEDQLRLLKKFGSQSYEDFDFWSHLTLSRPIYLHVNRNKVEATRTFLQSSKIQFSVTIEDVQKLVDSEITSSQSGSRTDDSYYASYHPYDENMNWMSDLAITHSDMADLFCIGKTLEGRMLTGIRLYSPEYSGKRKRSFWIQAGIHAREWITVATVNYIIGHLISDYQTDPVVKHILDEADIYFLPIMNPDGYAYTWSFNRYWRKNRNPNNGSICKGVDLNRNWGYGWGSDDGSDPETCSDIYRGTSAFSEIETSVVAEFAKTLPNLVGVVDVHSFSQLWMYPWDHIAEVPPVQDAARMDAVANTTIQALESVYGTDYVYGPGSILYLSAGTTPDWFYGELGVVYSSTIELRDLGVYGFTLPESQIIPSGIETYEAFKAYFQAVISATPDASKS